MLVLLPYHTMTFHVMSLWPDIYLTCYILVTRYLPHMLLWPDNHFTDYVTLTSSTAHSFAIVATYPCSYIVFHCSQAALNYSFAATFIFPNRYFVLEDIICSSSRDFVKYLKHSVPAIFLLILLLIYARAIRKSRIFAHCQTSIFIFRAF